MATSAANSSNTPLALGASFTGTVHDAAGAASVSIMCTTDAPGTLHLEFSTDAATYDYGERQAQISAGLPFVLNTTLRARYFRVRLVNGNAATQTFLRLQTLVHYHERPAAETSTRIDSPGTSALQIRAGAGVLHSIACHNSDSTTHAIYRLYDTTYVPTHTDMPVAVIYVPPSSSIIFPGTGPGIRFASNIYIRATSGNLTDGDTTAPSVGVTSATALHSGA